MQARRLISTMPYTRFDNSSCWEDGLEAVEAACAEALAEGACSHDVVLNILARRRQPAPPAPIPTPVDLRLRLEPTADCARYEGLMEVRRGTA